MSIRAASTMVAALHGGLTWHPWRSPTTDSSDAYSLFVARSSAMGWLSDAVENPTGGLWGMNEAEHGPDSGSHPPRVAYFQVSRNRPVSSDQPLPVQPFLVCAGDVIARMGTLDLRAIQLMVPVQDRAATASRSSHQNAVMSLMQDAGWFVDCPEAWRTSVQITLDSGQDPTIRAAIPGMLQWIRQFKQNVFMCDSVAETDHDENVVIKPAVIDQVWNGPPCYRVTVHGTLVSWSLDALGWLAALLVEASAQYGVTTPILITAGRNKIDGAAT